MSLSERKSQEAVGPLLFSKERQDWYYWWMIYLDLDRPSLDENLKLIFNLIKKYDFFFFEMLINNTINVWWLFRLIFIQSIASLP